MERVFVADAAALIESDLLGLKSKAFTTPLVLLEVREESSRARLDAAFKQGLVEVVEVPLEFLKAARLAAEVSTDFPDLSNADFEVLALCLKLKREGVQFTLLTDDYALQNAASKAGISFEGVSKKGIKSVKEWVWRCRACGKAFPRTLKEVECPSCSGELAKKEVKG